jgi:hypothetical protein
MVEGKLESLAVNFSKNQTGNLVENQIEISPELNM